MGDLLAGPYLAACALLVAAGLPKLRDPLPLVRAIRSVGLPAGRQRIRLLAAAEVVLGVAGFVRPGPVTAGLVTLAYLVFSGFVALALSRGGVLDSCGCFGKPDTPPTKAHLLVTAVLAAASAWTAVAAHGQSVVTGTAYPLVILGYAALVAFLAWLVMAVLPTTTPAAVRGRQQAAPPAPQKG